MRKSEIIGNAEERGGRRNVPEGSRWWKPSLGVENSWSRMKMSSWNPQVILYWRMEAAEQICSWGERIRGCCRKGAGGEEGPAEKKERNIYSLCLRGKMEIWCAACTENEDLFEYWFRKRQSWLELISEHNDILLRNWRTCVDTIFWRVSRKVMVWRKKLLIWKKSKCAQDLDQSIKLQPMGWGNIIEDADLHGLAISRW